MAADQPVEENETGDDEADGAQIEKRWRLANETITAIGGLIVTIWTVYGALHGSGGPT